MRHPHSCGGPLSFEGSCGAGDCYTCHPEWYYETAPEADDEAEEQEEREEESC
jgi:ferredoxin